MIQQKVTYDRLRQVEDTFWENPYNSRIREAVHEIRSQFLSQRQGESYVSERIKPESVDEVCRTVALKENPDLVVGEYPIKVTPKHI